MFLWGYIHYFNLSEKLSLGLLLGEDFCGLAQARTRAVEPGGATSGRDLCTAGRRATKPGATLRMAPHAVARSPSAQSLTVTRSLELCRCTFKVIKEDIMELESKGSQDHNLDT